MFCRRMKSTKHLSHNLMTLIGVNQSTNNFTRQMSGLCLEEKVVIVTGAGGGIGAAAAHAFSAQCSKVVIADMNKENVDVVCEQCKSKYSNEVAGFHCDMTKDEQVKKLVAKTLDRFGCIDVVVNNAGILTFGSLLKGDLMDPYDRVMAVNLRGCVYLAMLAAPHLVKTKGNIINISSILGHTYSGNSKYMPYCISKAGLDHFMFGAALELAPHGVRVNNVCPGPIKTEIFATAGVKQSFKEIGRSFKLDDCAEPSEVADLIVYLASHKARSISGVRVYIDKGHLVRG